MLVLNVGCGPRGEGIVPRNMAYPGADEIDLDINPGVKPDVAGDLCHLPFPENTFDGVIASHIFEHLDGHSCLGAAKEVYRVLKKGGMAHIRVPDLEWAAKEIVKTGMNHLIQGVIYGNCSKMGGRHLVGYDAYLLVILFQAAGFKQDGMRIGHQSYSIRLETPGEPTEVYEVPDLGLIAIKG